MMWPPMSRFEGFEARASLEATPTLWARQQAASRARRRVDQVFGNTSNRQPDDTASTPIGGVLGALEALPMPSDEPERFRIARDALAAFWRAQSDDLASGPQSSGEALCALAAAVQRLGADQSNPARHWAATEAITHNLRLIAAQLNGKEQADGME